MIVHIYVVHFYVAKMNMFVILRENFCPKNWLHFLYAN